MIYVVSMNTAQTSSWYLFIGKHICTKLMPFSSVGNCCLNSWLYGMNAAHCSSSCYESRFIIFIKYCLFKNFFFFFLATVFSNYNVRKFLFFWPQSELLLWCVCSASSCCGIIIHSSTKLVKLTSSPPQYLQSSGRKDHCCFSLWWWCQSFYSLFYLVALTSAFQGSKGFTFRSIPCLLTLFLSTNSLCFLN